MPNVRDANGNIQLTQEQMLQAEDIVYRELVERQHPRKHYKLRDTRTGRFISVGNRNSWSTPTDAYYKFFGRWSLVTKLQKAFQLDQYMDGSDVRDIAVRSLFQKNILQVVEFNKLGAEVGVINPEEFVRG